MSSTRSQGVGNDLERLNSAPRSSFSLLRAALIRINMNPNDFLHLGVRLGQSRRLGDGFCGQVHPRRLAVLETTLYI
jgi:hypothetical protein